MSLKYPVLVTEIDQYFHAENGIFETLTDAQKNHAVKTANEHWSAGFAPEDEIPIYEYAGMSFEDFIFTWVQGYLSAIKIINEGQEK